MAVESQIDELISRASQDRGRLEHALQALQGLAGVDSVMAEMTHKIQQLEDQLVVLRGERDMQLAADRIKEERRREEIEREEAQKELLRQQLQSVEQRYTENLSALEKSKEMERRYQEDKNVVMQAVEEQQARIGVLEHMQSRFQALRVSPETEGEIRERQEELQRELVLERQERERLVSGLRLAGEQLVCAQKAFEEQQALTTKLRGEVEQLKQQMTQKDSAAQREVAKANESLLDLKREMEALRKKGGGRRKLEERITSPAVRRALDLSSEDSGGRAPPRIAEDPLQGYHHYLSQQPPRHQPQERPSISAATPVPSPSTSDDSKPGIAVPDCFRWKDPAPATAKVTAPASATTATTQQGASGEVLKPGFHPLPLGGAATVGNPFSFSTDVSCPKKPETMNREPTKAVSFSEAGEGTASAAVPSPRRQGDAGSPGERLRERQQQLQRVLTLVEDEAAEPDEEDVEMMEFLRLNNRRGGTGVPIRGQDVPQQRGLPLRQRSFANSELVEKEVTPIQRITNPYLSLYTPVSEQNRKLKELRVTMPYSVIVSILDYKRYLPSFGTLRNPISYKDIPRLTNNNVRGFTDWGNSILKWAVNHWVTPVELVRALRMSDSLGIRRMREHFDTQVALGYVRTVSQCLQTIWEITDGREVDDHAVWRRFCSLKMSGTQSLESWNKYFLRELQDVNPDVVPGGTTDPNDCREVVRVYSISLNSKWRTAYAKCAVEWRDVQPTSLLQVMYRLETEAWEDQAVNKFYTDNHLTNTTPKEGGGGSDKPRRPFGRGRGGRGRSGSLKEVSEDKKDESVEEMGRAKRSPSAPPAKNSAAMVCSRCERNGHERRSCWICCTKDHGRWLGPNKNVPVPKGMVVCATPQECEKKRKAIEEAKKKGQPGGRGGGGGRRGGRDGGGGRGGGSGNDRRGGGGDPPRGGNQGSQAQGDRGGRGRGDQGRGGRGDRGRGRDGRGRGREGRGRKS